MQAAWAKLRREAATAVYNGMAESTFDEEVYSPLPETVPESIANLTTFLHIVSLVGGLEEDLYAQALLLQPSLRQQFS